jgi:hypothetical protein
MRLRRFARRVLCMKVVSTRGVRMVGCLLMIPSFMMLCCMFMMLGCFLMVLSSFLMVFDSFLAHLFFSNLSRSNPSDAGSFQPNRSTVKTP